MKCSNLVVITALGITKIDAVIELRKNIVLLNKTVIGFIVVKKQKPSNMNKNKLIHLNSVNLKKII